jgi:hypothetical protein
MEAAHVGSGNVLVVVNITDKRRRFMKFLQIMGKVENSSFTSFEFEEHIAYEVNCGDQIWSNGQEIQIADYTERDNLEELISMVDNRQSFKGALRRLDFI